MSLEWILPALLALPAVLAPVSFAFRTVRAALRFCALVTIAVACLAGLAVRHVSANGVLTGVDNWLMMDALSAYHLIVMMLVFVFSSLYSTSYFSREERDGHFDVKAARRYAALFLSSLAAMLLVLVSNNLGMMWVGIEATTLSTAFLIIVHLTPASLEAMWKYLLICSVGIALAFAGTLLVAASATDAHMVMAGGLHWTSLMESARSLDARLIKIGFIFIVVGFGTKAGLAPMHSWLPDAHSQAPAPVSAIFSGFLLNTALYCVLRYVPLVDAVTGDSGWARGILVALGVASILIAAAFIVAQRDVKRLLAYCSVEHIGIVAFGAGMGGAGVFAALFHVLNHSVCKTLSFFCAGSLGQIYGAHDMRKMTGIMKRSPIWGMGLFGSFLALIGVAPFALFLSEFLILKSAWDKGAFWPMAFFVAGIAVVFVGFLRHAIRMAWEPGVESEAKEAFSPLEGFLVFAPLAGLLILGLWMPQPLRDILTQASRVVSEKI